MISKISNLEEISSYIKDNDDFIIATHISPDSDAHGSAGGLFLLLKKLNKKVKIYLPEKINSRYKFITEGLEYVYKVPESSYILLSVDTATKERLGEDNNILCSRAKYFINIDHHTSNKNWASSNYVDSSSPATACIIYKLSLLLNVSIDLKISNLLYAGILDDTGSFRYSNTTEDCLIIASRLIAGGATPGPLSNSLHFEVPERVMRLRAKAFENLILTNSGQIASIYVDNKLLKELGCTSEDSEGMVDLVRSIEGVKLAFFIRELDNKWKVSCRTKDDRLDVNELAKKFGGGGHKAASGFTTEGTIEKVLSKVQSAATEILSLTN